MKIKKNGNGIGLMLKGASLNNHLPGWEKGTYAMHSDDGNAYYNNDDSIYSCKSFAFGPAYQRKGAVVGCGYNFNTREVFFTHEGQLIGSPFSLPNKVEVGGIVPCVGLHTSHSIWAINLGFLPFKFNIDAYICGEDVEKLEDFQYNESLSSTYHISRKEIADIIATGGNFLVEFQVEKDDTEDKKEEGEEGDLDWLMDTDEM